MLTTAPLTWSARSASESGPRAKAGPASNCVRGAAPRPSGAASAKMPIEWRRPRRERDIPTGGINHPPGPRGETRSGSSEQIGRALRVGAQHDDVTIGLGINLLRLFRALRAVFRGFSGPLRLHAAVDFLGDLARQIGATNTRVDDTDAEAAAFDIHLLADAH